MGCQQSNVRECDHALLSNDRRERNAILTNDKERDNVEGNVSVKEEHTSGNEPKHTHSPSQEQESYWHNKTEQGTIETAQTTEPSPEHSGSYKEAKSNNNSNNNIHSITNEESLHEESDKDNVNKYTNVTEAQFKTFSSEAAEEYRSHVEAKRAAEEKHRHQMIMESFDPIRPLDNFNINHRGLLGCCWDRRAAEIAPISYIHVIHEKMAEHMCNCYNNIERDAVTNNETLTTNFLLDDKKKSESYNNATSGGSSSSSSDSSKRNEMREERHKVPIARTSHWFAAAGLTLADMTNSKSGNSTSSIYSPTRRVESNNNNNNNNTIMASSLVNTVAHSPLSRMADATNRAASSAEQLPIYTVNELKSMSYAERLEYFNKCVNVQLKNNGIKPNWAFCVSHEVSESEDAKELRKRNLQPAYGVEIHYWNRAEFVIPSFHSLQQAVLMLEGEHTFTKEVKTNNTIIVKDCAANVVQSFSPSYSSCSSAECITACSHWPNSCTSLPQCTLLPSNELQSNSNNNNNKIELVKQHANDPLHDCISSNNEPLVVWQEHQQEKAFPANKKNDIEVADVITSTITNTPPKHSVFSFAHHRSNINPFHHSFSHEHNSFATCLLAHNQERKPFPQSCISSLNLAIPTSWLTTLHGTPLLMENGELVNSQPNTSGSYSRSNKSENASESKISLDKMHVRVHSGAESVFTPTHTSPLLLPKYVTPSLFPTQPTKNINDNNNNINYTSDNFNINNQITSPNINTNHTYLSALAICCFNTSIDPLHWSRNKYTRLPIDLELGKVSCTEEYGEGVITSIMYGGTLIVECSSYEAAKQLEDVLAGCSWATPRTLSALVSDVRHRLRNRTNWIKQNRNSNNENNNNNKSAETSKAEKLKLITKQMKRKDSAVINAINKTLHKRQVTQQNSNNTINADTTRNKNGFTSNNNTDDSNNNSSTVYYRYRISQRIGGHPMRDKVEFQEISLLLGESGVEEQAASLFLNTSPNTKKEQFASSEPIRSSNVNCGKNKGESVVVSDNRATELSKHNHKTHEHNNNNNNNNNSSNFTSLEQVKENEANSSYSRIASVWVGLHTIAVVLRSWGLHLLAHPEYAMPTSLYLQKYAGIAPALLTNTLTSFSFHDNVAGHWCAFDRFNSNRNGNTYITNKNNVNSNHNIEKNNYDNAYDTSNIKKSTTNRQGRLEEQLTSNAEDEYFANDLLFNDPHDLTNLFAAAEEYPHGPVKRVATSMLSLHKPTKRIPSYNKFYVPTPTPSSSVQSKMDLTVDEDKTSLTTASKPNRTCHKETNLFNKNAKQSYRNNNKKDKVPTKNNATKSRNSKWNDNKDKYISWSWSTNTLPHCNQSKTELHDNNNETKTTTTTTNNNNNNCSNNVNSKKKKEENVKSINDSVAAKAKSQYENQQEEEQAEEKKKKKKKEEKEEKEKTEVDDNTSNSKINNNNNNNKNGAGLSVKRVNKRPSPKLLTTLELSLLPSPSESCPRTAANTCTPSVIGFSELSRSSLSSSLNTSDSSSTSSSYLTESSLETSSLSEESSSSYISESMSSDNNSNNILVSDTNNVISNDNIGTAPTTTIADSSNAKTQQQHKNSNLSKLTHSSHHSKRVLHETFAFSPAQTESSTLVTIIAEKSESINANAKSVKNDRNDSNNNNNKGVSCNREKKTKVKKWNSVTVDELTSDSEMKRQPTLPFEGLVTVENIAEGQKSGTTTDTAPLPEIKVEHKSKGKHVHHHHHHSHNEKSKNVANKIKRRAETNNDVRERTNASDGKEETDNKSRLNKSTSAITKQNPDKYKKRISTTNSTHSNLTIATSVDSEEYTRLEHNKEEEEEEEQEEYEEYYVNEHENKWNMTMLELKALQQEWQEVCAARDEAENEHNILHNTLHKLQRVFLPCTSIAEIDGVLLYLHTAITQPWELFQRVFYLNSGDWLNLLIAVWVNQSLPDNKKDVNSDSNTSNAHHHHNNSINNNNDISALCYIDIATELTWRDLPKIGILAGLFHFNEGCTSRYVQSLRINAVKLLGSSVSNNSLKIDSDKHHRQTSHNHSFHLSFFQSLRAKRKAVKEQHNNNNSNNNRNKSTHSLFHKFHSRNNNSNNDNNFLEFDHADDEISYEYDMLNNGNNNYNNSSVIMNSGSANRVKSSVGFSDSYNNNFHNNNFTINQESSYNSNNNNNVNDIIASGPNHGLGVFTPPFYITFEQARDILWVLLCAIAENALCICNTTTSTTSTTAVSPLSSRTQECFSESSATPFHLIFDGFPLDLNRLQQHHTNHNNHTHEKKVNSTFVKNSKKSNNNSKYSSSWSFYMNDNDDHNKLHKNNNNNNNSGARESNSLLHRLFHVNKNKSTAEIRATAEQAGCNEVCNLDSFIIIPQTSSEFSFLDSSPLRNSIHSPLQLRLTSSHGLTSELFEYTSDKSEHNTKARVNNNNNNINHNSNSNNIVYHLQLNDTFYSNIHDDEHVHTVEMIKKSSDEGNDKLQGKDRMSNESLSSKVNNEHEEEEEKKKPSSNNNLLELYSPMHKSDSSSSVNLNFSFHIHRESSQLHCRHVHDVPIHNNNISNNSTDNNTSCITTNAENCNNNVEEHAFYSILYHTKCKTHHSQKEQMESYSANRANHNVTSTKDKYEDAHNMYNMHTAGVFELSLSLERIEYINPYNFHHNNIRYALPPTRERTLLAIYEKSGKWKNEEQENTTNDNINDEGNSSHDQNADCKLQLHYGDKIFGLESEREEREVLINEIGELHSHSNEIWETLCKAVDQFNKTHLAKAQEQKELEEEQEQERKKELHTISSSNNNSNNNKATLVDHIATSLSEEELNSSKGFSCMSHSLTKLSANRHHHVKSSKETERGAVCEDKIKCTNYVYRPLML